MSNPALAPAVRQVLEQPGRFGVLSTVNQDGSPHQAVVWYRVTDEGILVNSAEGRRWPANLRRDGRASLLVEDGYQYIAVTGTVDIIDDQEQAQADIAGLARTYHADDPAGAERLIETVFRTQRRVSFLLRPRHVTVHRD